MGIRSRILGCVEVLGKAGNRDYDHLGIVRNQALDQAQPVHFGHPKVRDYQGDVVLLVHRQRDFAIAREEGRVPGILDNPSLEKPIRLRVIDYQYVRHISDLS